MACGQRAHHGQAQGVAQGVEQVFQAYLFAVGVVGKHESSCRWGATVPWKQCRTSLMRRGAGSYLADRGMAW